MKRLLKSLWIVGLWRPLGFAYGRPRDAHRFASIAINFCCYPLLNLGFLSLEAKLRDIETVTFGH